jgi:hypothetical protein
MGLGNKNKRNPATFIGTDLKLIGAVQKVKGSPLQIKKEMIQ